jgi:FlaA1/EpsC-like NDP-sugar epimerase
MKDFISQSIEAKLQCKIYYESQNGDKICGIREVAISDLLELKEFTSKNGELERIVKGKVVLMNGSAGRMAVELGTRLIKSGCKTFILVERYESYLTQSLIGLHNIYGRSNFVPILIDNDDENALSNIFSMYKPDIVIQAALRKHSSILGIKNKAYEIDNCDRNLSLSTLASKNFCSVFVMVSSISADCGNSEIDKSLRRTEIEMFRFFKDTATKLIITRICDVAENICELISSIGNQVKLKKKMSIPVQVPEMTIITCKSAAEFIINAMADAVTKHNSNIYTCDFGQTIKIADTIQILAGICSAQSEFKRHRT